MVEDEDVLQDRYRCSPEAREGIYQIWTEIMSLPNNQKAFAEQLFAKIIEDNVGSNYLIRKSKEEKLAVAWRVLAVVDEVVIGLRSDFYLSFLVDSIKKKFGENLKYLKEEFVKRFGKTLKSVMEMASYKKKKISSHIADCLQILYKELIN